MATNVTCRPFRSNGSLLVSLVLTIAIVLHERRDHYGGCSAVQAFNIVRNHPFRRIQVSPQRRSLGLQLQPGQATELPDSLADAAIRAAEASVEFCRLNRGSLDTANGAPPTRCRVDFDTSVGDETFTLLKQSTEFMQQFVTALSYAVVPNVQQARQAELLAVASAKTELAALRQKEKVAVTTTTPVTIESTNEGNDESGIDASISATENTSAVLDKEQREDELVEIIRNDGRDPTQSAAWSGGICRVYFPDEGSAALARRDWAPIVPVCVHFSSCQSIQLHDTSRDVVQLFFCPRAAESDSVESILAATETSETSTLLLTVFVNPILVDMGVTGFGMAGRRLRERLLDTLVGTYYLRTLPWGALTRQWPGAYTVWQEDANEAGGYKLVTSLDRLPSNPEVEDIYDVANGNMAERQTGGFLDQLGDFVNGMMRL